MNNTSRKRDIQAYEEGYAAARDGINDMLLGSNISNVKRVVHNHLEWFKELQGTLDPGEVGWKHAYEKFLQSPFDWITEGFINQE